MKQTDCEVAVLAPLPAPYTTSVWNQLARLMDGRLEVCFLSLTNSLRRWRLQEKEMGFAWRILGRDRTEGLLSQLKAAGALLRFLMERRPTTLICGGYDSPAAWVGLLWCRLLRSRLVLACDSNARDCRKGGALRNRAKRFFVAHSDAVAVPGRAAFQYARELGASEGRIFTVPFGLDTRLFACGAQGMDPAAEKRSQGWPPRLILFAGRLVEEKGVFVLLEAYRQVSRNLPGVGLLFVGEGPARPEMAEYCREASLPGVFFGGAQDYKDMPYFYALADILVLPTFSDAYGYVVIEAFACGVPAIVSTVAGVCDDFLRDGETGFAVTPGDAAALARRITEVLGDDVLRARMSANCRRIVEGYSPEACAEGLLAAASGGTSARSVGLGTVATGSP